MDIGYKSEGLIPSTSTIRKGADPHEVVELGQHIEALVLQKEDADGRLILSAKRAAFERAWNRIEEAYNDQRTVEAVIEVVKGGLILDIGLRGFLPEPRGHPARQEPGGFPRPEARVQGHRAEPEPQQRSAFQARGPRGGAQGGASASSPRSRRA